MVHKFHIGHLITSVATTIAGAALVFLTIMPRPSLVTDFSINGSVAPFSEVIVTPTAAATDLILTEGHTETALKVADVFQRSNVWEGSTVTVASANLLAGGRSTVTTGPCLYSAAVSTDFGFDLLIGAASLAFSGGSATWSDLSVLNLPGTTASANVAYSVVFLLPEGTYTETLIFTITAK